MSGILSGIVVATQLALAAAPAAELRGLELMAALRSGGYTIVVRHARTDYDRPNRESPSVVPPSRQDQRNLSPAGEEDVVRMASVVRQHRLPIGEVISSPMYRCRETAAAFGADVALTMDLRTYPTVPALRELLAARPAPGTNRVLVTHHFVIETGVPGIRPGDVNESEAVVIRTTAEGTLELVGRILLADWTTLAHAGGPAHGS